MMRLYAGQRLLLLFTSTSSISLLATTRKPASTRRRTWTRPSTRAAADHQLSLPSMESPAGDRSGSSSSLLGSLRTAVKKVRFLLSFSATRWILSSIAGTGTRVGGAPPRRVSFNSRPSLLDADESIASPPGARPAGTPSTSRAASLGARRPSTVSRTSSAVASELSRTSSAGPPSSPGDDDIDQRAELFIANFYKHIQMERQVSLQLRYCRDRSLERTPSR